MLPVAVLAVMFLRVNREQILHTQVFRVVPRSDIITTLSSATSTERYQYATTMDINNTCYKKIQSLIRNHVPVCTVSLLKSRE